MEVKKTELPGLLLIEPTLSADPRGSFVKTFQQSEFSSIGIPADFKECYHSTSIKGVIRGMHLQLPPHHHDKLVSVVRGRILDVALDLRVDSPTYLQAFSSILGGKRKTSVFLPSGFAHGFRSLTTQSVVLYLVTSERVADSESGVRWDSFGFDWGTQTPIVSTRDMQLPNLADFHSTFTLGGEAAD